MSCKYYGEKLEAYVLGLLDPNEQLSVKQHLQLCPQCRARVARQQQATVLLQQAFTAEPDSHLLSATLAKIKTKAVRRSSWLLWGAPVMAGAAAWLLVWGIQFNPQPKSLSWQGENTRTLAAMEQTADQIPAAAKSDFFLRRRAAASARATVPTPAHSPALPQAVSEQIALPIENPIADRSIYQDLGVATEVANLLL